MPRSVKPSKNKPADDRLQNLLEKLAIQLVTRAAKTDRAGVPVVPLGEQISALKAAGTFWGLTRKHTPDEAEGSAWGDLSNQLATGAGIDDDDENDEPNGPTH